MQYLCLREKFLDVLELVKNQKEKGEKTIRGYSKIYLLFLVQKNQF